MLHHCIWGLLISIRDLEYSGLGLGLGLDHRAKHTKSAEDTMRKQNKYGNKSFIISFSVMVKHRFDVAPQQARHGEGNNHLIGENKAFV